MLERDEYEESLKFQGRVRRAMLVAHNALLAIAHVVTFPFRWISDHVGATYYFFDQNKSEDSK